MRRTFISGANKTDSTSDLPVMSDLTTGLLNFEVDKCAVSQPSHHTKPSHCLSQYLPLKLWLQ